MKLSALSTLSEVYAQSKEFKDWIKACRELAPNAEFGGTEKNGGQMVDWTTVNNEVVGEWDGMKGTVFTDRRHKYKGMAEELDEELLDEAKRKKRKKRRLKRGDKVVHRKTGAVGTVSGPLYVGGGLRFWPVVAYMGGGRCETGWHDHDTHGSNDSGEIVSPAPPPMTGGDGGGDGGGGGE